jgi:hypothetical protein
VQAYRARRVGRGRQHRPRVGLPAQEPVEPARAVRAPKNVTWGPGHIFHGFKDPLDGKYFWAPKNSFWRSQTSNREEGGEHAVARTLDLGAVILHCQLTAIDYHSQCLGIYTVILLPLLAMFLKNDGVAPGLVAPVHTVVIACHAEVAAPAWLRAWTRNSDPGINS